MTSIYELTTEDRYVDSNVGCISYAFLVPPNRYVLKVKENVDVIMSSSVGSGESLCSSVTVSDIII